MNFSTNQVRQFYVVESDSVVVTHEGTGLKQIVDPNGSFASDLIDPKKITKVISTGAYDLGLPLPVGQLRLKEGVTPEVGKTYTFKIYIQDLYGAGNEYNQPLVASAEAKTTKAIDLYSELLKSLNAKKYGEGTDESGNKQHTWTYILNDCLCVDAHTDGIAVYVNEDTLKSSWVRGISPLKEIKFKLCVDTEVWDKPYHAYEIWEEFAGMKLADLEYFCMGERGDQYRMMGYPNYIPTEYKIDPNQTYNVVDIMYYHSDNKEGVQRSEKVITLAIPVEFDREDQNDKIVTNKIISKLLGTGE